MTVADRRLVLITGASSGIGEMFARRFASQGANLVLVARRRDRLEALSAELFAAHGTTSTVLVHDLTEAEAPADIAAELQSRGLKVDGLVNSAGFGTAGAFVDEDPKRISAEIQVNVAALTGLTRLLLPQLLASPAGLLINISSTAAYQPLPNMAVYAATKAYVTALTEAIWQESRGTALRVLSLAPGPTETEFFAAAGSDLFRVGRTVGADKVVDAAFTLLGKRDVAPSHVVGTTNRITAIAANLVPRRLALFVAARLTGE